MAMREFSAAAAVASALLVGWTPALEVSEANNPCPTRVETDATLAHAKKMRATRILFRSNTDAPPSRSV